MKNTDQCKVSGCDCGFYCKGYCSIHYRRALHSGRGPELKIVNHPLRVLRRNRLAVLRKAKGKCEICSEHANTVHHKNFSHDNHNVSNLMAICNECHSAIHGDHGSKYKQMYGMKSIEIARLLGVSQGRVSQLHKTNRLDTAILNGKLVRKTNNSKYRSIYGWTLAEISKKTGLTTYYIKLLDRNAVQQALEHSGI